MIARNKAKRNYCIERKVSAHFAKDYIDKGKIRVKKANT